MPLTGCDFINDIINPPDPPSPPEPPIVVDGEIVNREEEKDISFLNSAWYKSLKTNI